MISVSESEIGDCTKRLITITEKINNDSITMIESTKQETKLCTEYFRAQTAQPIYH